MMKNSASVPSLFRIIVVLLCTPSVKTNCPPCKCHEDKLHGGTKVDCSNRNLNNIPETIPVNATILLFNDNKLTNVTGLGLKRLAHLHILDLSSNSIHIIEEDAFDGQSSLCVLNLSSNHLALDSETYKPNVFRALRKLKVLRIEHNNYVHGRVGPNATYPDVSLGVLTSLEELHIDGLPADFGPGFARIRNLTTLSLSSKTNYCHLPILRNTTFINVPSVQHLNISNCLVKSTEPLTWKPLKHIKSIDISDNRDLGFSNFSTATYGLQSSPIEVMRMNRIYPEYDVCSRLEVAHVSHLRNTKLKELHIDGNGIISMQHWALSSLPESLEIASARENKFQYGNYMMETLMLKSIKYFDVSGINKMKPLPFLKRHATRQPSGFHLSLGGPVPVPKRLETLIVADCSLTGKITPGGVTNNSLKNVIVNNNFLSALGGPITGFDKVEYFDFSNNILEEISYDFFAENNSLSNLSLSSNFLGRAIGKDINGKMFSRLGNVRILDISKNRISVLPVSFFKSLVSIESILLSDNYLETFHVDLQENKNLSVLDLSGNKIQMIPSVTLKGLEQISLIMLRDNPLLCSCESLYFLRWLQDNTAHIDDWEDLKCRLVPSESKVSLTKLASIIKKLDKDCHVTDYILVISITSVSLFILGGMCASVCYRHRWKLRYLYYVGRRAYKQRHAIDHGDDETYQYDVYVSYADQDRRFVIDSMLPELENKAGLRMCIRDRDFLPGEVIADTIVEAIQASRWTLILLSPSFLKCEWSEFEYQMARMEGVAHRQNIVVVVSYKNVPLKDMPKDMALMFTSNHYLEYNDDDFCSVVFWPRMVETIRSSRQTQ